MDNVWLSVSLVVFFILLGGVFAASELALVSLRESQLHGLEARGKRGRVVVALARDPNRFLGAVQIGVTISGFFSAAFGATAIAPVIAAPLVRWGLEEETANVLAVVTMTVVLAYLSLVFGELAPKRLALQRAEGFSLFVAPIIAALSRILSPLIWLVGKSSDQVVRALGGDPNKRAEALTDEELQSIVESHEGLDESHRAVLGDVLEAANHRLESVMKPRADVVTMDKDTSLREATTVMASLPYSRYPLISEGLDDCESFVHIRDVMAAPPGAKTLADIAREIPVLPASMKVFSALNELRARGTHIALVVDEYGGADGLVTLEDLVEELIGDVFDEHDLPHRVVDSDRLSVGGLVPGDMSIRRFEEITGVALSPGPYTTVAGYVLAELGSIPTVGDISARDGAVFEVVAMTGRRIVELKYTTETTRNS